MNIHVTLVVVVLSFVRCDRPCSREDSRLIRDYFTQVTSSISRERPHSSLRLDRDSNLWTQSGVRPFGVHLLRWSRSFLSAGTAQDPTGRGSLVVSILQSDLHLGISSRFSFESWTQRNSPSRKCCPLLISLFRYLLFFKNDQSVCLADYCSIFRCDVLRRSKRSSHLHRQRMKQILNEQQLTLLRTRCAVRELNDLEEESFFPVIACF